MLKYTLAVLLLAAITLPGCAPATSAPTSDAAAPPAVSETAAPSTSESGVAAAKVIELTPANTQIEFVGTKPEGKHPGGFKDFSGELGLADDKLDPVKIAVKIKTESLYSDVEKLTNHLKDADFFEVKAYPEASFVSKSIIAKPAGDSTHEVTGDLTLRGVTKSITFPVAVSGGNELSLKSSFTISRKEFGMTYGEGKVDDPVQISVNVKTPLK